METASGRLIASYPNLRSAELSRDGLLLYSWRIPGPARAIDTVGGRESPFDGSLVGSWACDWTDGYLGCVTTDGAYTVCGGWRPYR